MHDGVEISPAVDVGPSARNEYIMVHHTGSPDAHLDKTNNYCEAGYDFFIRADGEIVVCPRWNESKGSHAKGFRRVIAKARNVKRGGCCFEHCPSPLAVMEVPEPGRDRLDAWSVGDLDYELYITDGFTGFTADARRGGDLLERRSFVSTPSGVLATSINSFVSKADSKPGGI